MTPAARQGVRFERVHAVTFDVGGTLVVPRVDTAAFCMAALRRLGLRRRRATVVRAIRGADQAVSQTAAPGAPRDVRFEMWDEAFLKAARTPVSTADWRRACDQAAANVPQPNICVADDAPQVLSSLQAGGYRLGVISNWSADLPDLLAELGIGDPFDVLVASEAVGVAKPDERIFVEALTRLGVGASACVHVGDDLRCDVEPARRLGMGAVLVDPDDQHAGTPCTRVHALSELLSHVAPRG